jgi:uncharacterized protein YvpB
VKKLCLLVSILPLLGCSNFNETNETISVKDKNYLQKYEQSPQAVNNEKDNISPIEVAEKSINQPIKGTPVNINPKKKSAMLNVVLINQNPELKFGCEVTSLTMMLNYAGIKTNKMELYRSIQKETDPLIRTSRGDILRWGNPDYGYVGDMTGRRAGTTVFDKPMISLINQKLPGRAVNLTNQPFERILEHVSAGYPVVVWTTLDYGLPKRWETWNHGQQVVRVPLDLHAVVLVGYDENYVYINDPLSVKKQVRIGKERFISSWKSLSSRAVSYN